MMKEARWKFDDQYIGRGVFLQPTEVADQKPVWSEGWLCRVDTGDFSWKYIGAYDKRTSAPEDYQLTGCQLDDSFALPVPQLGENVQLGQRDRKSVV